MSRQDYAPKHSEIRITDLTRGLGEFQPKPEKPVSLPALEGALQKAGYKLEEAKVTARGVVEREAGLWYLRIPESKQRFELRGFANLKEGGSTTLQGRWTRRDAVDMLTARDAQ